MTEHERQLRDLLAYYERLGEAAVTDRPVCEYATANRDALRWALAELERAKEAALAERLACHALALADLDAGPGRVAAPERFDGGSSERAARRIAAAILARGTTP